jgi:hypothetical protein
LAPDPIQVKLTSGIMSHGSIFGLLVLGAVAAFQVWVTLRVYRSRLYEPSQKSAQAKLIWLLPALGAVIAFSVLTSEEQRERRHERSDDGEFRN